MKKWILVIGLCLVLPTVSFTQNYADEFGTVKGNDLQMNVYARDKAAEAVILFDIGNTYFTDTDNGYRMVFERTTRIKILSKAGLDYAQVEIPYYVENNQMETVYEIEGYTYNIENSEVKRSKLDPENSFDDKTSEHWRIRKFAMPDVKAGSVIEYRYKVMSPYFFNLQDWEFQHKIPVIYSEYTVRMIPFYEYSYIFQGASKFDVFKNEVDNFKRRFGTIEYTDNIFTFGMKNIPAFRDEDYITSFNDYIMKIDFQLSVIHYPNGANVDIVTTWPLLIKNLLKQSGFGLYMNALSRNAEDIVGSFPLTSKSLWEKGEFIFDYVKSNYNWNGLKDKSSGKTAKEFLKEKTGNSAEINLFLCSMLNSAGIQAYPVLISTRDHGKLQVDYPFQHFLNYVIVVARIDNQDILLDATEPLSLFGMLPARCINEKGLIVNKDKVDWIELTDNSNSALTDSVAIKFNESLDSVYVDFHVQTLGHKALDYRREYLSDATVFTSNRIKDGMESRKALAVQNDRAIEKPFIFDYGVASGVEAVGDKLLVVPFPDFQLSENPLKLNFRSYPVDMIYKSSTNYVAEIEIPPGYAYVDQKKSVSIDNALVAIHYQVDGTTDRLKVTGSYEFKKAIYLPHEYIDLKGYFAKIIETFNDKLVFAKVL